MHTKATGAKQKGKAASRPEEGTDVREEMLTSLQPNHLPEFYPDTWTSQ